MNVSSSWGSYGSTRGRYGDPAPSGAFITGLTEDVIPSGSGSGSGGGGGIANILAFLNNPQTQATVSQLVQQYGPGVKDIVDEALANSGQSVQSMQLKLVRLQAEYARTSNAVKRSKLAIKIQTLMTQIQAALAAQQASIPYVQAPSDFSPSGFPEWAPYAIAGVVAVGALAFVATRPKAPAVRSNPKQRRNRR